MPAFYGATQQGLGYLKRNFSKAAPPGSGAGALSPGTECELCFD